MFIKKVPLTWTKCGLNRVVVAGYKLAKWMCFCYEIDQIDLQSMPRSHGGLFTQATSKSSK